MKYAFRFTTAAQLRAISRPDAMRILTALTVLGDTYADQGNTTMARAAYEEAVALAEPSMDLQGLVPALAGLARVVAPEEPELAEQLLSRVP